eukprot:15479996-Alexandrium_andersonii.AAC.1
MRQDLQKSRTQSTSCNTPPKGCLNEDVKVITIAGCHTRKPVQLGEQPEEQVESTAERGQV